MNKKNRKPITLEERHIILRGQVVTGITAYGPFNTAKEAIDYGTKYFSEDTFCVCIMYKEIENAIKD
jgi:hypothetical protein